MLAMPITYENLFTGEKVTKTFYFHVTKAEMIELEHSVNGGLSSVMTRIIEEHDNQKLIPLFKRLIEISYGERTDNGGFKKSKEATEIFLSSEAYSELFMSFYEADNAINFIKGIMPKDVMEEVDKKFPDGVENISSIDEIKNIDSEKLHVVENNDTTK